MQIEKHPIVKKDSQHRQARKRWSRGRRCVFLGKKNKILSTAEMPNMKDVTTPLGETPRYTWSVLGTSLSETARGPIVHQGNRGAFWSLNSAELLLTENHRKKGCAKELHHIGFSNYETASQHRGKRQRVHLLPGVSEKRPRQRKLFCAKQQTNSTL